jgi:hypothetical protein
MNRRYVLYAAVALLALFLAGCAGPCDKLDPVRPVVTSGSTRFARYVALGTSIGAGYQSGGLVETHQFYAYPAQFARQAAVDTFAYDRITPDGIPALLQLVSLNPLSITNAGRTMGSPRDLAYPRAYDNLCVPGAVLYDCTHTDRYASGVFPLIARGTTTTLLQQAASLGPDVVSFEYGANEVLGPALSGSGTPLLDVNTFAFLFGMTLDALQGAAPTAKLVLFNVPDVTTIPYVTTVKPYVVNPADGSHIPLIGPEGLLPETDYVLLSAADSLKVGTGLPAPAGGNGRPLLGSQVLTQEEAASLVAAIDGYNAAIAGQASLRGAALVDLHGLLLDIAGRGYDFGGAHYSSALVTGGMFSLDGIHPTDFADGVITNAMIDAVNTRFGASIPQVNLREVATISASRARPASAQGVAGLPRVEGLDKALAPLLLHR